MAKLTDVDVKKAKAEDDKIVRLKDEHGLYLEISKKGIKSWRQRIRATSGDTIKTLGYYPTMSLAQARRAQMAIRLNGVEAAPEPVEAPPAKPTFKEVALLWHTKKSGDWKANHAADVLAGLERDVFPAFGAEPIDAIESLTISKHLATFEARGVMEVAHDVRQRIERIFGYARASGYIMHNPASDMKEVMRALPPSTPRAAITDIATARGLLADIEAQPAGLEVKAAMRLLAITAQRPGEVMQARWDQFEGLDGDNPVWKIPGEQMKMKREHWVPLPRQAVELLQALRNTAAKNATFCFPSPRRRGEAMDTGVLRYAIIRTGRQNEHCPHGWRASFSTTMKPLRRADGQIIEMMLAHVKADKVAAAYDRAEYLAERREIAQEWADLLLQDAKPAEALVDLPRRSIRAAMEAVT
jgi:integrase